MKIRTTLKLAVIPVALLAYYGCGGQSPEETGDDEDFAAVKNGAIWSTAVHENRIVGVSLDNANVARTSIGGMPIGLVYDAKTHRFFSASHEGGEVWVTSRKTNKVVSVIKVGTRPYWIVQHPTTREVFAGVTGDGVISVIDPDSLKVKRVLKVGGNPVGLAISQKRNTLYIADVQGNRVAASPLASGAQGWEASGLSGPVWVDVDEERSRIFVAESNAKKVAVLNANDGKLIKRLDVGASPAGLIVAPKANRLIVLNHSASDMNVFELDTMKAAGKLNIGPNPIGSVVSPDGKQAAIALAGTDEIKIVDLTTMKVTRTLKGVVGPRGLAWVMNVVNKTPALDGGTPMPDGGHHGFDGGTQPKPDAGMAPCAPKQVCGVVNYRGDKKGPQLAIVLHDSEPPMGPPLGVKRIHNPTFPQRFDMDAPVGRTYYYRVWIDMDGAGSGVDKNTDPMANPKTSPSSTVPSSGAATPVVLELTDPPHSW